jgi:hypothetical protein
VSGVSGPAGPVTGGPWAASGEFTPAPGGLAPSGPVPPGGAPAPGGGFAPGGPAPGGAFAPGGPAPRGGRAPARGSGRRGGLAVVAAIVAAVVLLGGAATAGIVLLNKDNGDKGGGTGQQTSGTGQNGGTGQQNGGTARAKYAMTALPENLCTKVDLGKLGTTYTKETTAPFSSRNVSQFTSYSVCTVSRARETGDALSVVVSAFVFADTSLAVSTQKQAFDTAKSADPKTIVLTEIGEEAFAAQTLTQSTPGVMYYNVEARDGNLRLTLTGTATKINGPAPTDQDKRQFATDLAGIAKSLIAKLGSG